MSSQNKHIKLDYLEMMAGNDPTIKQTLLELLIADLKTELPKMRAQYEAGNWADLYQTSHKMKSTLDYSGNEAMQQANLHILINCGDQHYPPAIGPALQELEALSIDVLAELEAILH